MDTISFNYQGKEYLVVTVNELEPEAGKKCIQIITKDNKQFKLSFKESIFKWVITESNN